MSPGRIVALVVGCLLALPGAGLLVGGASLGLAVATQRDADGYFEVTLDRISTDAYAVTAGDIAFDAEPGTAGWALGAMDADVRLRVTVARDTGDVFVGIARAIDVEAYLDDVEHDEVVELVNGRRAVTVRSPGQRAPVVPTEMVIWAAEVSGPGTVEVVWPAQSGRWAVVVMNADAEQGFESDVEVGLRLGFLVPLAIGLFVAGVLVAAGAVGLIVWAVRRRPPDADGSRDGDAGGGVTETAPVPTNVVDVRGTPLPPPPPPTGRPPGAAATATEGTASEEER